MSRSISGNKGPGAAVCDASAAAAAADLSALMISDKKTSGDTSKGFDENSSLFAPPPPREDCPICLVTLPLKDVGSAYGSCCGMQVCAACIWAHQTTVEETNAQRSKKKLLTHCCAFCRVPTPKSESEAVGRLTERAKNGDVRAIFMMGCANEHGNGGLAIDRRKALEMYHRAADLGLPDAYHNLSCTYAQGICVKKDKVKERYYLEMAAKGGLVSARHNLGVFEIENGNPALAMKHFQISAAAGDDESLKAIRLAYAHKAIPKDTYATALRANHKAHNDEKSEQRDRYAAFLKAEAKK